ncbi:hypothetical protein AVEN_152927-1 [Araneus ventricosus]|uniref:Uncharacterized protein n=1 Tax=Araneus ventricosus TaxID=182803 RepID=A0A4Y2AD72_ARAVE|nr:hypothetical protein AVEN_152927-1 [Araneus ventricosus]
MGLRTMFGYLKVKKPSTNNFIQVSILFYLNEYGGNDSTSRIIVGVMASSPGQYTSSKFSACQNVSGKARDPHHRTPTPIRLISSYGQVRTKRN